MFLFEHPFAYKNSRKNTWAHEGPHISEKTKKEVGT
jgi:hypothetical protein